MSIAKQKSLRSRAHRASAGAKQNRKGARAQKIGDPIPPSFVAAPDWVASAQTHFSQTGFYRATDLLGVLGEPETQVTGEATSNFTNHMRRW